MCSCVFCFLLAPPSQFTHSRSHFVDESKTKVFRNIDDPREVCIFLDGVDAGKMGSFMGSEAFMTYNNDHGFEFKKEEGAFLLPAGPDAPAVCNMFAVVESEDGCIDKWIAGFKAHATSKTGTWGFEVPMTREEFCDDTKTKIFKSVSDPNVIAIDLHSVEQEKIAKCLMDPSFGQLLTAISEKDKAMYFIPKET